MPKRSLPRADELDIGWRHDRFLQRFKDLGLKKRELARAIGAGEKETGRYVEGETAPGPKYLARICYVMNIAPGWVLGLTDDPVPHGHKRLV